LGAYGATKAAFDNLLASYAQEVAAISGIRVAIVDPGATRTKMRAKAYPGENPASVKAPDVVAARSRPSPPRTSPARIANGWMNRAEVSPALQPAIARNLRIAAAR
jgi:NAD(P)-dependent dehydrogenase (short-subunit alcohol dehydrogenase family)